MAVTVFFSCDMSPAYQSRVSPFRRGEVAAPSSLARLFSFLPQLFPHGSIVWIVKGYSSPSVCIPMNAGDSHRKIAAELKAKAGQEPSATLAAEWDHLARCYLRLAEQPDNNSFQDIWFEIGLKPRLEGEGA